MVRYLDNNSGFAAWNANRNMNTNAKSGRGRLGGFLWWAVLFLASWWLIGMWTSPKNETVVSDADVAKIATNIGEMPAQNIKSDEVSANVRGLRISDIELLNYRADSNSEENVILLNGEKDFAEVGLIATGTTAPDVKTAWRTDGDKMVWKNSDGVTFTRQVTIDGYLVTVTDEIKNKTKHDIAFAPYAKIVRADKGATTGVSTGAISNTNSKINYADWHKLDNKTYAYSTTNGFIGFADQYWETVANIASPDQMMSARSIAGKYVVDSAAAAKTIAPGDTGIFTTTLFAGPRSQHILDAAATVIPGIDKTIDYGWFWFFAQPMLWMINAINAVVMNYGIAIIIMTILLRLLMWPLTRKSYASSITMQKMQPELQRIQKLYANDKPRLQMEMMNLYRTHKTSPMSGCLPMLIQIPIFFALYKALLISVNMRNAGFLWIHDLAAMDPYFILPILMGATMWLQQYMQSARKKSNTNDANSPLAASMKLMKWLPIIFAVMFAWMPAGLVLYWTVSNIFGIIQTYIIQRKLSK